jgi:Family of unknown function (DUF6159)
MGRIANGWRLAKASWHVLSHDRELVAIPVIAGIVAVIAFAVVGVPAALLLDGDSSASRWAAGLLAALGALLATWVTVIGQAAVMVGAAQRMDGADPTLGGAYAGARGHSGRLLQWAALATIVSIVLDVIQDRLGFAGDILAGVGNMAFRVLSFLALPVIVFEEVGAIEGFKRSSQLLRGTWGEQLTFSFGIGLLGFLAALPAILLAIGLTATGVAVLTGVGITIAVLWVLAVAAVTSALSAVFKVALYRYARHQPVAPEFSPADLSSAFRPRAAR